MPKYRYRVLYGQIHPVRQNVALKNSFSGEFRQSLYQPSPSIKAIVSKLISYISSPFSEDELHEFQKGCDFEGPKPNNGRCYLLRNCPG